MARTRLAPAWYGHNHVNGYWYKPQQTSRRHLSVIAKGAKRLLIHGYMKPDVPQRRGLCQTALTPSAVHHTPLEPQGFLHTLVAEQDGC